MARRKNTNGESIIVCFDNTFTYSRVKLNIFISYKHVEKVTNTIIFYLYVFKS